MTRTALRFSVALTVSMLALVPACGADLDDTGNSMTFGAADEGAEETGGEDEGEEAEAGEEEEGTEGEDNDAGEGDDGPACGTSEYEFELEAKTPSVMLVLDKSRSMSNYWDHDGDANTSMISRWHSLVNVTEFVTDTFGDHIDFGAQLFPSADAWLDEPINDMSCKVLGEPEVAVGPGTGPAILAAIPDAGDFSIAGGTPASAGVDSAVTHLQSLDTDAPKAVILLTDGAPNCNPEVSADQTLFVYDDRLPGKVGEAFDVDGIPTYVVGINILDADDLTKPAVNPIEAISDAAIAGGAAREGDAPFYNTFNEIELEDALWEVANRIECTVNLTETPDFPDQVMVNVGGSNYSQVGDCETDDGWTYVDPQTNDAVVLCGQACDDLQDTGKVDVTFGCP